MGASVVTHAGKLPARLNGGALSAIDYRLPTASAQVKSAVLLAGLGAEGVTKVIEPILCRDHTERMLGAFGVTLEIEPLAEGRAISLAGGQRLRGAEIIVPGDPSSAAFLVAAALITPGSDVTVENVLMNPLRDGFFRAVKEMGAAIEFLNERVVSGEPVADIRARTSRLSGAAIPASWAPSMIDEYPILAVVAAFADGDVYMPGIEELRVKETDRIDATVALLAANGVETDSGPDWLRVCGKGATPAGGGLVKTEHDHRIAMAGLVLGMGAAAPVTIDDGAMIATSFPSFAPLMAQLGARIAAA